MYKKVMKRFIKKGKNIFALLTIAGSTFNEAYFQCAARIIRTEDVPDKFDITRLFPIWKKKRKQARPQHDEIHSLKRMGRTDENGIFQVFDMAKFFDKESLIDTLYTLHTEAAICDNDYRILNMVQAK